MPHKKAVEEIVRNSGSQFDPDVVMAFLEAEKRGLLNSNGFEHTLEEMLPARGRAP